MRLCSNAEVPEGKVFAKFGASVLANAAVLAVFTGLIAGGAWLLLKEAGSLSGWVWLFVGPFIVLGVGGALLLFEMVAFENLRSSLRPGNWVMKCVPSGVYLNLRCHLNAGREPCDETAVFLTFEEIKSAQCVEFTYRRHGTRGGGAQNTTNIDRFLQLELRKAETTELNAAVSREFARDPIARERLGLTVKSKSHGSPLHVVAPGLLRVTWSGQGMLRALEENGVELTSRQRIDEDVQPFDPTEIDARLVELCQRGHMVEAISLACRIHSMSISDARDLVDGLTRKAA